MSSLSPASCRLRATFGARSDRLATNVAYACRAAGSNSVDPRSSGAVRSGSCYTHAHTGGPTQKPEEPELVKSSGWSTPEDSIDKWFERMQAMKSGKTP